MLGKTSVSAIRTLALLAQQDPGTCLSPRRLALRLGESPTYLAKVARQLVKAGILEVQKGGKGGVRLRYRPETISLLTVIAACQPAMLAGVCPAARTTATACSLHCAALELQEAVTAVLGRWTIARLLEQDDEVRRGGGKS